MLMLILNIKKKILTLNDLNTSHVNVNRSQVCNSNHIPLYLNTSHVNVNPS